MRNARRVAAVGLAIAAATACGPKQPSDEALPDVVLFSRSYLQPIYREDVPHPEEVGRGVALRAARGEREPASVAVRTKVPLSGARLVSSELRGPEGAVIPADAIEVRTTRYIAPLEKWRPIDGHPQHPGYLDARGSVEVAADTAQQFWVTVAVPRDAAPGGYRGTLELKAGERSLSLPMELEVYPFELGEAGPAYFLYGDNWPLEEERFRNSRDHGMNTICVNPGWIKQVVPEFDGTAFSFPQGFAPVVEVVEKARAAGLGVKHPICVMLYQHMIRSTMAGLKRGGVEIPPDAADGIDYRSGYELFFAKGKGVDGLDRYKGTYYPARDPFTPETEFGRLMVAGWKEVMRALDEAGRERGWPQLFYYVADEPHQTRGSLRLAMLMVKAAADAGADAMITCNEPTVSEPDERELWFRAVDDEPALRLEPYLKTRCYYNRYLGEATEKRTREAGDHYGTYVNIYGNQPASVRYQSGYLAYRLGLDHVMLWAADPASAPFGESRSYLRDWEAVREGIDDLKYLELLRRRIDAGAGGAAALEAARATLERVRAQIDPGVSGIGYVDGQSGLWVPGKTGWPVERYDELRAEVAAAIVSLGAP